MKLHALGSRLVQLGCIVLCLLLPSSSNAAYSSTSQMAVYFPIISNSPLIIKGLAFTSGDIRTMITDVYTIQTDGTARSRLTAGRDPAWSPDGHTLALIAYLQPNHIQDSLSTIDLDTSRQTDFLSSVFYEPAWSPDSAQIVWAERVLMSRSDYSRILRINSDGTDLTTLLASQYTLYYHPVWSPDGAQIMFSTYSNAKNELWLMNSDGTDLHNLGPGAFPSWSPDGSRIAFVDATPDSVQIAVMNPDGSGRELITHDPWESFYPAWSPDGTKLAFAANRYGNWDIFVMNVDGTGVTQITSDPDDEVGPVWFPFANP